MKKTYIIIGASAAGIGAVNTLRNLDPEAEIIVISSQQENSYNTCFLADYLAGTKTQEQLTIFTSEKAQQKKIQYVLGKKVVTINNNQRTILLDDGQNINYDAMFIATGTRPLMPTIDGIRCGAGVFTFHTLADSNSILAFIATNKPKQAVIIGAGLSGLECADALRSYGLSITVIEKNNQLLSSLVTPSGAQLIAQAMQQSGIKLHTNEIVTEILHKHDNVHGVRLGSETVLPADMVICTIGLQPNSELAHSAGIALENQSILVDDHMKTSDANIYAGGDVVMTKDFLTGSLVQSRTWPDAMFHGLLAAHAMVGSPKPYQGLTMITSSAFFGLKFASSGLESSSRCTQIKQEGDRRDHTFYTNQGRLQGFCLVGPNHNLTHFKRMLLTQESIDSEKLLRGL